MPNSSVRKKKKAQASKKRPAKTQNHPQPRNAIQLSRRQFGNTPASRNSSALEGWKNPSSSYGEVVFQATDYYDSTPKTHEQYNFSLIKNNILDPPSTGSSKNLCRVIRAKFYALPRWNSDSSLGSVMVLFGIPSQSLGASAAEEYACIGQRSTLLTPTTISNWAKVGEWNEKMFMQGNVLPAYDTTDEENNLVLGSFTVVEPDNGALSSTKIQMRIVIEYAQTLPNIAQIYVAAAKSEDPLWNRVQAVATSANAGVVNVLRVENKM